jgi:endonuclease/exonuclease/phosphatase family metal-dependent hydrolase
MNQMKNIPLFFLSISLLVSQRNSVPINIDGQFEDWNPVLYISDDNSESYDDEDFYRLRIANDDNFLFIELEFRQNEILMQDWNDIHLFIDVDANSETGLPIHGIGAELDWCFGCRSGQYYFMDEFTNIYQNDLTLRIAPTITGQKFEFALSRSSNVLTMDGTQIPTSIKIVLKGSGVNGDMFPNQPGGIDYEFDSTPVPPPEAISLGKNDSDHVRILSYNVWSDGLFNPGRQPRFERIIKALEPDIMGFQEAYDDNDIETLFEDWLPGVNWYVSNEWNGNYVVSRYPILYQGNHSWKSMGVLLDTEADLGTLLFFINSHFSCCGSNDNRQEQVDELMGFLRDLKNGSGPFTLEYGTPIVHVGDFNLVGYRQQLETLTHGDIVDEVSYGSDFYPDWDDSPLTDLFSRHTHTRMGYTWRHDGSEYNPGKLDYILYTDWVLEPENHFVLNTMAMTEEDLFLFGLELEDTNIASDHLPRIMDINETIIQTSLTVHISAGWNMVGLPLNVLDNHYLTLFPTATEGSLFNFNLTYLPLLSMFTGEGYWLHFQNGGETTIFGNELSELTIQILDGWNLISGITSPIHISDIDDPEGLILIESWFHFQDGLYNNVDTILPGKSYWIYSTGVGVVGLTN